MSVSGIGSSGAPMQLTGANGKMGKEEFLQLLVAQLRHQDPLNPMQPDQFAAQLAQFSSVEQLVRVNELLEQQMANQELLLQGNAISGAMGALGRTAIAATNNFAVGEDGTATIGLNLNAPAEVTMRFLDASGAEVATRTVRAEAGKQKLEVEDLPPGTYRVAMQATGSGGAAVAGFTYTTGRIDALRYTPGGAVLVIGGVEMPLSSILEIQP
jgi:flagellar basal-body rod modification protein FlgD